MAFRQHNKSPDVAWRKNKRAELLAAGIPDEVVDDERRWTHLLLHSYDIESGWDESWITREQAVDLVQMLKAHYLNTAGYCLIGDLERKIKAKAVS